MFLPQYALFHNNDSLDYINADGEILEFPVVPDAFTDYKIPPPVANNTDDRVIDALPGRKQRIRRALSDQLTGAAVIKLILFIDKGAIDKFKPLNNNDEAASRTDLRRCFTLIVNEMTVMYQTLRTHGVGYTRGTVTQPLQNFAVQLVDVQFPTTGGNFQFAIDNLAGNDLDSDAGLDDFRTFMASYTSGIQYDHAAWISGNDLVFNTGRGNVGLAWTNTLCSTTDFNGGYHTSVIELTAGISRILSHELGHGFGMGHDGEGNSCQQSGFIMGATLALVDTNTQATFSKFSSCSAADVTVYTLGIGADFRSTCLLPPDSAFFLDVCKGFKGTTPVTLDEQCKKEFGASSTIDLTFQSQQNDVTFLQNNYVTSCVRGVNEAPYTIWCNVGNNQISQVSEVMMGTKCVKGDRIMDPNNICIHGECTSLLLCNTNNPAPPPPNPLPPPPPPPNPPPPNPPPPTLATTPLPSSCPCADTTCCRIVWRIKNRTVDGCCPECQYRIDVWGRDCTIKTVK
ncbi:uncharacterized protein LOC127831554 [Dreissena polymorpha]|uniref:uncharacterized protein LOC127831554 n=1 Tax=Dreissena polymorpha TaxID=45954 RepID=UPI0022647F26|nr:uncharacterized protein LOC127831554 [Dreissena polymorpha]